jgi:hypothetical protein
MSARMPHTTDPVTVPSNAKKGTSDTVALGTPYSMIMPGTVNPSAAGFMMSMIRATTSTAISPQCAGPRCASSGAAISKLSLAARCAATSRGSRPYAATRQPMMISPMPATMSQPIGMPASMKCMLSPIMNMGTCISTPVVTAAQPSAKIQAPRRSDRTLLNRTTAPPEDFPRPISLC